MLMKKLSEDHYVLTDDSEIRIGNIVAEKLLTGKYELFTIHTLNDIDKSTQKKITHSTQPLGFLNEHGFTTANLKPDWTNVEYLPLSEVKEVLGVVDVKKRAEEKIPNLPYKNYVKIGFIGGYNLALEDNKEKEFTKEDMIKAMVLYSAWITGGAPSLRVAETAEQRIEQIIQSLEPKTEWEVEFVDGKLKLKS